MSLLSVFLDFVEVLVELVERVIPVVLSRDVGAQLAKVGKLLLHILGGRLDVRLDPLQVFFVVHLCPRISNDLDVLGEELVAVLE
jgi:hypothetical protein